MQIHRMTKQGMIQHVILLQCDMAVATKFFFDMVDSNHTMVMVFGDACSSVSGPIAEISKEWNVSLVRT